MWRDTQTRYWLVTISLHWLIAAVIIGLFALGLWMVDLNYYHPWYQRGPAWHKGLGILMLGVLLVHLAWRAINSDPVAIGAPWEQTLARWVHNLLNGLLLAVLISGYLISTADGRSIEVFGWFSVPASLYGLENQEDLAGFIHAMLAYLLIGLAGMHALAALKHHFIDGDEILKRMFP